jgi:hypothetical protein
MLDIQPDKVMDVVQKVETETHHLFEPQEVTELVQFTVHKCEMNGKDTSYFYILLENELTDFLKREFINLMGERNRMLRMEQMSVAK